ncbi:MAG TPA: acyl carrier protein [Thermoleophilaceae bacterium]|nr:acyl carrier protein [Thermoleophilaceae bacterium]
MTVDSIRNTLLGFLAVSRGKSVDAVEDEIGAEGLIDSLEGVELVAAIEKELGVKITDRELSSRLCSSIPRLTEAVAAKLAAKADAQAGR